MRYFECGFGFLVVPLLILVGRSVAIVAHGASRLQGYAYGLFLEALCSSCKGAVGLKCLRRN
jgi:hypothetical protein